MENMTQALTKDVNSAQEFDLNKPAEENEVHSNVVEDSLLFAAQDPIDVRGFPNIDLNKFPEEDYENNSYEKKEKKKLLIKFKVY
ncbi:hypothetical protein TSUD_362060 [Trifolium subterraneum]|uniref:Uncharacterized protein n=1 Tax=Trifolium subterraneum TaxID=3900 RepID=A0A2Z6M9U8_TRISU|nr:hypothetical protein TSUD_362060 [Trifolium subterraneum]